MVRTGSFPIVQTTEFIARCLEFFSKEESICLLDSHLQMVPINAMSFYNFDALLAVGSTHEISAAIGNTLEDVDSHYKKNPCWLFGYLSYDLKNSFENLHSEHADNMEWPDFRFFQPQYLFLFKKGTVEINIHDSISIKPEEIFYSIENFSTLKVNLNQKKIQLQPRMLKDDYVERVEKLRRHIRRGDIYEVNFCQEFFATQIFEPFLAYNRLSRNSPAPFACFLREGSKYLVSASPERFLKKTGNLLISQPIKGTAPRGKSDAEDQQLVQRLLDSKKERSENIMIVDLVRNDLAKIANPNSVKVDELCGIYSFSQVHQLISTVSAVLKEQSFEKIIQATFPMGSMTGAPKVNALQLAEKYENFRRGIYSGAVGYITPEKDFDFNVVIRSLQYRSDTHYLSGHVGGAITYLSDPEQEYEECLVKARSIEIMLND